MLLDFVIICHHHHRMDVAISTSELHAEGSLMENTSDETSLVARQANARQYINIAC